MFNKGYHAIFCLFVISFVFHGSVAFADHELSRTDDHHLIVERIDQLEKEIRLLHVQLDHITLLLGERNPQNSTNRDKWGCYVTDIDATFYGTGNTEAEARGKALHECKKQVGVGCFEQNLKCSTE